MDVERYITDEVLSATADFDETEICGVLRAVLPVIYPRIRADVLRGVLSFGDNLDPEAIDLLQDVVRRMADEAVAPHAAP